MDQTIQFHQREIPVKATLDVQAVETALNDLWREKAVACVASPSSSSSSASASASTSSSASAVATVPAESETEDGAMMRARVLNLMFYVTSAEAASEVSQVLSEVTPSHPCRAFLMIADDEERDIQMSVAALCQSRGESGGRRVCCEQITLRAGGRYELELPSAATPLLVSDLPVFLYWRDELRPDDSVFQALSGAADRIVLDSAEFRRPVAELTALVQLLPRRPGFDVAFSDLNWSRLTSWRALLASFYDVQEYRPALAELNRVTIEYVAPSAGAGAEGARALSEDEGRAGQNGGDPPQQSDAPLAPQALMMGGWLASRLGWRAVEDETAAKLDQPQDESARTFFLGKDGRRIALELRRVERPEMKPGRLARVKLRAEGEPGATFVVSRSEDGLYLETQVSLGEEVRAARVLRVRNRSAAVLLGRELEIISHEEVYEEALRTAARMARLR